MSARPSAESSRIASRIATSSLSRFEQVDGGRWRRSHRGSWVHARSPRDVRAVAAVVPQGDRHVLCVAAAHLRSPQSADARGQSKPSRRENPLGQRSRQANHQSVQAIQHLSDRSALSVQSTQSRPAVASWPLSRARSFPPCRDGRPDSSGLSPPDLKRARAGPRTSTRRTPLSCRPFCRGHAPSRCTPPWRGTFGRCRPRRRWTS